jgi:hypothetical protein
VHVNKTDDNNDCITTNGVLNQSDPG